MTMMVKDELPLSVEYHVKELKNEIEQEFIEVLKNNVIDPYKTTILLGNKFAFVYVSSKRFKHVIRFKFEVYRRNEVGRVLYRKYHIIIGTIYVIVNITNDEPHPPRTRGLEE